MATRKKTQAEIARGRRLALKQRGITFDPLGRARKNGKRISTEQLEKEVRAVRPARPSPATRAPKSKTKPAPRPATHAKPTKPTKPKMSPWPPKGRPKKLPPPTPTIAEELRAVEKKLTKTQRAALKAFKPQQREDFLRSLAETERSTRAERIRSKLSKEQKKKEERERKEATTALGQLRKAVKAAAKDGGKLYGEYNPQTHKRQKIRGTFSGFKRVPFEKRADYIQEDLRRKYPKEWRRDLLVQSVHVREYLVQGDGGAGRRAIIEKALLAGRRCLDERAIGKDGKPLRVYQIYIGMIRILIRQEDAGKYGGYATRPIDGKKIKAVTDIRGLEGFEKVTAGEDPKAALDRILERLENHLDDILDGLPVVYVKSLQIKFDVEALE